MKSQYNAQENSFTERGKNVNDEEEYVASGNATIQKKTGNVVEMKQHNNYGYENTPNDKVYSERGIGKQDQKKLEAQAKPNDRLYQYLQ